MARTNSRSRVDLVKKKWIVVHADANLIIAQLASLSYTRTSTEYRSMEYKYRYTSPQEPSKVERRNPEAIPYPHLNYYYVVPIQIVPEFAP